MVTQAIYPRLALIEQHALLRRVISRCHSRSSEPTPVVVFDLDGTLMENRTRTCTILKELASTWAQKDPDASNRLMNAKPDDLAYLLTDSLEKLGVHRTELVAEAEQFWRERFFADDHLRYDIQVPGAVSFVRACYDAGATIVYLTGRDLPLMGIGTYRSLRDLGFPIGVFGTELVLKPDAAMPDEAFKRLSAPLAARVGKVIASFDNEPANCNVFLAVHPDCDSVLVDTQHLPGAPPLAPNVKVIGDFLLT